MAILFAAAMEVAGVACSLRQKHPHSSKAARARDRGKGWGREQDILKIARDSCQFCSTLFDAYGIITWRGSGPTNNINKAALSATPTHRHNNILLAMATRNGNMIGKVQICNCVCMCRRYDRK